MFSFIATTRNRQKLQQQSQSYYAKNVFFGNFTWKAKYVRTKHEIKGILAIQNKFLLHIMTFTTAVVVYDFKSGLGFLHVKNQRLTTGNNEKVDSLHATAIKFIG